MLCGQKTQELLTRAHEFMCSDIPYTHDRSTAVLLEFLS